MDLGQAKIDAGLRIYAIGDIHGCLIELQGLLEIIDADLARYPVDHHRLIFLGDYVDRGPASRQVLELLIDLNKSSRDSIILKGNHEDWLTGFLKDPELTGTGYMRWGGIQTLASYGVEVEPGASFTDTARQARKQIPRAHWAFMRRLPLSHCEGDYLFVHAGIRPGISLEDQMEHDLIWIRDDFLSHGGLFDKVIVHGHTPVEEPEVCNNRINLDTRCFDSGVLTALVLEGSGFRLLNT